MWWYVFRPLNPALSHVVGAFELCTSQISHKKGLQAGPQLVVVCLLSSMKAQVNIVHQSQLILLFCLGSQPLYESLCSVVSQVTVPAGFACFRQREFNRRWKGTFWKTNDHPTTPRQNEEEDGTVREFRRWSVEECWCKWKARWGVLHPHKQWSV